MKDFSTYKNTPAGSVDGHKVAAITDGLGSNVVVGESGDSVRLLSQDMGSHAAAVKLADEVALWGTGYYTEWIDLCAPDAFHFVMVEMYKQNIKRERK